MKPLKPTPQKAVSWSLALAGVCVASQLGVTSAEDQISNSSSVKVTLAAGGDGDAGVASGGTSTQNTIVIKAIEPTAGEPAAERKGHPWLGLGTDEASEALTAQLGLDPGVGLVVTYVAPASPAAKAGLQKNDVLVELENHALVHPAQLRRLVQARHEGEVIKLVFYRAGKKQTASATLAKTAAGLGALEDDRAWDGHLRALQRQLRDLRLDDAVHDRMKVLRETLGRVQIDQDKLREELRHSADQARKALREALRHATNAHSALGPAHKALQDLTRDLLVDNGATVTVRSSGQAVKTIVKTDESGTILLVRNPTWHLTAHDKAGSLIFDGDIETPEQRAQVPRKLWKRVEPLLDKEQTPSQAEEEPEITPGPEAKPTP